MDRAKDGAATLLLAATVITLLRTGLRLGFSDDLLRSADNSFREQLQTETSILSDGGFTAVLAAFAVFLARPARTRVVASVAACVEIALVCAGLIAVILTATYKPDDITNYFVDSPNRAMSVLGLLPGLAVGLAATWIALTARREATDGRLTESDIG